MDFNRGWTPFALDAEVEHFGTARIARAHNDLRAEVERLRTENKRLLFAAEDARRLLDIQLERGGLGDAAYGALIRLRHITQRRTAREGEGC